MDPQKFADAAVSAAISETESALRDIAADGLSITVNSIRLVQSQAEMIVSASMEGRILIEQAAAHVPRHAVTGKLLPHIVDVRTGKIMEIMKEAPSAQRLARLASLSSVVIGAAHLIATADIAKKLRVIDGKLDALIQYRRIDQVAVLEKIYTFARELASAPLDDLRRLELMRLRGELRQLRSTWRRELIYHLDLIENPEQAGWLERTFTSRVTNDRTVHGKISEVQIQLALIEYSMRLDQVLAVGSNSLDGFERSLADELVEIRSLSDLFREKANFISVRGKNEYSVEPMIAALDGMIAHYGDLLVANPYGKENLRISP